MHCDGLIHVNVVKGFLPSSSVTRPSPPVLHIWPFIGNNGTMCLSFLPKFHGVTEGKYPKCTFSNKFSNVA